MAKKRSIVGALKLQKDAERKIEEQQAAEEIRKKESEKTDIHKKLEEGPEDFRDVVQEAYSRVTLFIPRSIADTVDAIAWKTGKSKNKVIMDAAMGALLSKDAIRITNEYYSSPSYRDKLLNMRIRQNLLESDDKTKLSYFYEDNYQKPYKEFGEPPYIADWEKQDGKDVLVVRDKETNAKVSSYMIQDVSKVFCIETEKRHRLYIAK